MKVSYNWLKDYVAFDKTPEQLAEDLSLFGHEAEAVEKMGDDFVIDLEITPNRGDCLSILGIAREIAALDDKKLRIRKYEVKTEKLDKKIEVKIEKPEICPRFTARIIDNIKIGESSKKIQERLATYGFRPINNIVDITNYVMVAVGQPLHAFDYDKIKDGLMRIRQAKKGEEVMTLDGKNRVLDDGAIVIEDDEKIYDLAGIMGGAKSEVDENTKTIILQGAIFDSISIRKSSKYLNHTTDASYRYERGVDYEGTVAGVDLATAMIKESCPGAKIGDLVDIKSENLKDIEIEFDIDRVNKLLGTDVTLETADAYLKRLDFKASDRVVTVPSYRAHDVKIWQDLAEEIARMYGYNNIRKAPIPKSQAPSDNLEFQKREYIKDYFTDLGFTEIYSYSFAEPDKIDALGDDVARCVEIANPLSPETQYLRPKILLSLLAAIAKNPWAPEVNIFEIEKVFDNKGEKWQLGMAMTGKDGGLLKKALEVLNIDVEIQNVSQGILDKYKIRKPVRYLLVDLDEIKIDTKKYAKEISNNKYRKISAFAPTVRDLAFIVESSVESAKVIDEISQISEQILLVELFDEFASDKFGERKKSLAFHIWLQDMNGPMKDENVENIIKKIVNKLLERYKAQLRSH